MAVRRLAQTQPASFEFTPENLEWAKAKIGDYPEGRQASAVIPILWKAQEQHNGWLPEPAIRLVADMLEMPYIRVFEIATFYTMFQLSPVGTVAHIGVCGTTPCMLRGSEALVGVCKTRIAQQPFALSADGRFSWEEVECAGACVNGPMVQIGGDTYEDLDEERFNALLDALDRGDSVAPGPQSARKASEPLSGATSLGAVPGVTTAAETPVADNDTLAGADAPSEPASSDIEGGEAPADDAETDLKAVQADSVGSRPQLLSRDAVEKIDNLQEISGIGPKLEATLHQLGVFTFGQIASWSEENVAWVTSYLAFPGRIGREQWVEQARAIVAKRESGA